jgi:hypothetical protein
MMQGHRLSPAPPRRSSSAPWLLIYPACGSPDRLRDWLQPLYVLAAIPIGVAIGLTAFYLFWKRIRWL